MKVLVVDDIGCIRYSLTQLVAKQGKTCVTASSGFEALKVLQEHPEIGVIISDLMMPGMDGVDLFRKVQMLERFNDSGAAPIPHFILMTTARLGVLGRDRESQRLQQATDAGMRLILHKPVDAEQLAAHFDELRAVADGPQTQIDRAAGIIRTEIEMLLQLNDQPALTRLRDELRRYITHLDGKVQSRVRQLTLKLQG